MTKSTKTITKEIQKKPRDIRGENGAKNLKPLNKRTPEERRAIQSKGGIASGVAKREKAKVSQIYADFLEEEFDVKADDGTTKKMSTKTLVNQMIKKIITRCDATSVSLLKEIREATEGTKQAVDLNLSIDDAKEIHALFAIEIKNFETPANADK